MTSKVRGVEQRDYKKGTFVFKEGDVGECAFLISEGEVEILKTIDQREVVLGIVKNAGMFGEMALISNKPRMAAARVRKDAKLMIITPKLFEGRLEKLDPFSRALIEVLSNHIRSISSKLDAEIRAS